MKVRSYNILFGGWDGEKNHRLPVQREVIDREQPAVLLLQKCKGFDLNSCRRLYEAEQSLGMRGFLALAPHAGRHTAIFARPMFTPIATDADAAHFHHSACLVTLRVPGWSQPLTVICVRLCPNGPAVPGAGFKDTKFVPFRSDSFLASAALAEKAVANTVVRDELTDAASDHHPITVQSKLEGERHG